MPVIREVLYKEFLNLSDDEMIKQIMKDKNTYNKQITRLTEKFGDSLLLEKYDRRISKDMLKNLSGVEKENMKRSLASDHAKLRYNQEHAKTYSTKGLREHLKRGIEGSGIEMRMESKNGKKVAVFEFNGRELSNKEVSDFYDKLHELQKSGKLNSIAYGSYDVKEVLNIYMNDGYDKSISDDDFERLMHEAVDIQEQRKRDEFNNGLNNSTTVENDMPF